MSYDITHGLLDPNLNFTAAQMEQQWKRKDVVFARAVVQFIAERFDGNLKGWAGYKYTYICEVPPSLTLHPPLQTRLQRSCIKNPLTDIREEHVLRKMLYEYSLG